MTARKVALTLPPMDDATWARKGWHGQQQWLRTAAALRRQMHADIAAHLADEASRAVTRRVHLEQCDELTRAQMILDSLPVDPDAPKRRHLLGVTVARDEDAKARRNASVAA